MKGINDSVVFNTLVKSSSLLNTIKTVDPKKDGINLHTIANAVDMINKKINYPTKAHIIKMIQEGRIHIIYNPNSVRTPKYLNVFGRVMPGSAGKPSFIVDIGRYAKGDREKELNINSRSLYVLLQNALITDVLTEKWDVYVNNDIIKRDGATAYSKLISKILIKLYAIDSDKMKSDTVRFMVAKFFLIGMCGLNIDMATINMIAYNACTGRSSQVYIESMEKSVINSSNDTYKDIESLFAAMKNLPGLNSLNMRSFAENWVRMYGEGSALAMDYLPAFLSVTFGTIIQGNIVKDPVIMNIAEKEIVSCYNAFCKML